MKFSKQKSKQNWALKGYCLCNSCSLDEGLVPRYESLVPRYESLVPKYESLVPYYESLVLRYERLASWQCRKLLLNPLLPTVPSGAQKVS